MASLIRTFFGGDEPVRDPVCGMTIPGSRARDFTEYRGQTYNFCSPVCRERFEREPYNFVAPDDSER